MTAKKSPLVAAHDLAQCHQPGNGRDAVTAPEFPLNANRLDARCGGLGTRRVLEKRSTRDARVPRVAGDDEFLCGWQNVPQRPTNDDAWFILDSSHDRTTTWGRWHEVEGCA